MKLKLFLSAAILFVGTTLKAQQKDIKLEDAVNEQFGTLLESLLVNGKIDEANAKTYLETVYGNDEFVNNYIEGVNLTQQIKNISKGNLSSDDYIQNLGSNLFNLIPANYQQQLLKNPSFVGWQLGQEMNTGKVSTETIANAINLIADGYKQNQKNSLIIDKLERITPKVSSIKATSAEKKTVVNDANNVRNWKLNLQKVPSRLINVPSYNKVTIESGKLVLEPSSQEVDSDSDRFLNIYKNNEKFDFSKNFKVTIKGSLDPYRYKKIEYDATTFSILIGQYDKLEVNLIYHPKNEKQEEYSSFSVKLPIPEFTTTYGFFSYKPIYFLTKNENVKTVSSLLHKDFKKADPIINKDLDLKNGFELIIRSEDGYLTFSINGIDTGLRKQITYMPNKFGFDIKADFILKTTIESVKLENL